jgi:Ca-activated chloride channel family protein
MRFAHPELLWAAPVAVALILAVRWQGRRRRRAALAVLAGDPGRSWADDGSVPWRAKADLALLLAVAVLLSLAVARPLLFKNDEQSELRGVPYIVALDLSRSMLSPDVRPNRWSAATNALARFLEAGPSDRVGLVTFSGVAYLNAPLSFDTRAILTMLRYTSPLTVDMDGETAGSDLGSAIERAGRYFVTNAIQPRVVILVTDGEDSGTQLLEIGRRWARQGVKVCGIGVGTRAGSKVPKINYGGVAQNSSGQDVISRLNEANLKRVTALTGGRYYPLGDRGEGFMRLREEFLKPLTESAAREDLKNYTEGYQVPLALAVLCLLVRFGIGARRVRRALSPAPIRKPVFPQP